MSAHKSIDRICAFITAMTVMITIAFCCGSSLGIETAVHAAGYENRLFDRSKVHTIDIVMDDWDSFIESCESEEYSLCDLVIDGEAVKNAAIRGKGNTSLSSVRNMDSSRYSFKIEFDHYNDAKSYHGLDKLCLNNIIQDNTYMKDYLAYTLMYDFGADAPLCSFAYITVNGEDWGLYLAVEAIEDSFLERNYGSDYGDLYKPDSMSFGGGGPGNGKDFSMTDFIKKNSDDSEDGEESGESSGEDNSGGFPGFGGGMPDFGSGNMPDFGSGNMPDFGGGGGFGGFGMGSSDVKLQYVDDDADSYPNIFGNAKTDVTSADEKRLINSLKVLSGQSDIESAVDTEEVLRYFVVHNFLCNGDSYTGQMIHNYYLYEEDGKLSMIPWDYNLAYGSFQGSDATGTVNSPIDSPVSGDMSDRPMVAWIFSNEEYTKQYHELFAEFSEKFDIAALVDETAALIDEYVEKDPTKFCTYEDFKTGVSTIKEFCTLRMESVKGQLDGTIPSTSDGQKEDSSALIDASGLTISDMGSMGGGFGGGPGGGPDRNSSSGGNMPDMSNMQMPEGFDPSNMPSDFGGEKPGSFELPEREEKTDTETPEETDAAQSEEKTDITKPSESSGGSENNTNNEDNKVNADNGNTDRGHGERGENSRPGDFPGMNGNTQKDNSSMLILLGASCAALLFGLIFAGVFKR